MGTRKGTELVKGRTGWVLGKDVRVVSMAQFPRAVGTALSCRGTQNHRGWVEWVGLSGPTGKELRIEVPVGPS